MVKELNLNNVSTPVGGTRRESRLFANPKKPETVGSSMMIPQESVHDMDGLDVGTHGRASFNQF